jgi:hypothetical protein
LILAENYKAKNKEASVYEFLTHLHGEYEQKAESVAKNLITE